LFGLSCVNCKEKNCAISVTQASFVCHGLAYITQMLLALTYAVTDCSADVGLSHSLFSLG